MRRITGKLIEEYSEYLAYEEKASATLEKYIHDVRTFSMWAGDCSIDKAMVLEYKEHLTAMYAPASVN